MATHPNQRSILDFPNKTNGLFGGSNLSHLAKFPQQGQPNTMDSSAPKSSVPKLRCHLIGAFKM